MTPVDDELKEAGKGWLRAIRPPKSDASDSHVQAWRWSIAITTGVTALGLATHIALACGLIASVHSGFARATDLEELREERRVERETDLETKILDVRFKQCTSDATVRSLHTQTLQKMLVEYNKLTTRSYPLPACEDFR